MSLIEFFLKILSMKVVYLSNKEAIKKIDVNSKDICMKL